ncbi:putative carboxylesterase 15 [Iris pallida]|uniref:Carboxylesterase 15 n=1 Tax=Iris pallida TaxID=29817 RepID=A0AAX6G0F8_IRIPA|nr:putative carboxylesterase 15 [Iris pallida]
MMGSETRKVVEEVSGWLRVFDDGTVDRTWTGPPEARFLMDSVPPYDVPRDGITVHDISGAVHPSARVYVPRGCRGGGHRAGKLPVLLHFHGGGFCISHATWLMYHQFYSRVASSIPAIVVSPFLPLAPENRLPAALDACYDALLWLRELAASAREDGTSAAGSALWESADFSRVFLVGDSSGGNLVHAVAARAGEAGEGFWLPLKVAGGIPIHPGFVRSSRSKSELEGVPDPFLTLDMLDKFLAFALPEGSSKDNAITCPMGEAAAPMAGLWLPPFLVFVAAGDLIRDTNLEYCEAVKRAGKDVKVFVSQGVGHSFYLNKMAVDMDPTTGKRCQELVLAIKDFVDRH